MQTIQVFQKNYRTNEINMTLHNKIILLEVQYFVNILFLFQSCRTECGHQVMCVNV